MKHELEQHLWDHIRSGKSPRDVIKEMVDVGMIDSSKQAWATLEKWTRKNAYQYGVGLDLGWKLQDEMPGAKRKQGETQ